MSARRPNQNMLQCQHRVLYVAFTASETPKHFAGFAASRRWVYCICSIRTLFDAMRSIGSFAVISASKQRAPHVANTASSLGGLGFGVLTANYNQTTIKQYNPYRLWFMLSPVWEGKGLTRFEHNPVVL
jgi:hypothetical protein